jgi:hypothetical protein
MTDSITDADQATAERLLKAFDRAQSMKVPGYMAMAELCFQQAGHLDTAEAQVQAQLGIGHAILALVKCFHDDDVPLTPVGGVLR